MLIVLEMHKAIMGTAENALLILGVCQTDIYELLGNYLEAQQHFTEAAANYNMAMLATVDQAGHVNFQEHLKCIAMKTDAKKRIVYIYQA